MATIKRFSYSLLISTLAFTAFTVVAFSGLFPWIEAQFYSPKVVADLQGRLDASQGEVDRWRLEAVEKVEKLLSDEAFNGVFSPTSSQASIQKRYQEAKLFLLGVRGGGGLRILGADREQVHFSTEDSDVKVKADLSVTYRNVKELAGIPDLQAPGLTDGQAHALVDPNGKSLFLLKPWKDRAGLTPGYLLFSPALEDLRSALVEAGRGLGNQGPLALSSGRYLFSLLGRAPDEALVQRVKILEDQGVVPPVQRLAQADGRFDVVLLHRKNLDLLVPAAMLELDPALKGLVLVSFFTLLFLVVFLVANLRGEPLSVVTRRVKQFQLQIVKQYFDLKEQDKLQSLRDELTRHSGEIRSDVRRSLGRIRKKDRAWVDQYIDTSWQEVLDLFRGPAPQSGGSPPGDWKRLEELLEQALAQGRFVVSGPVPAVPRGPSVPSTPTRVPQGVAGDLEELDDVEELDDLEDADEGLEDAEELVEDAETAEAVEDLDEVEELTDAEEFDEAEELTEVEGFEGAEAVDDDLVEDLEDVEVALEAEDLLDEAPAEPLEELAADEVEDEAEDDVAVLVEPVAAAGRPALVARTSWRDQVTELPEEPEDVEDLEADLEDEALEDLETLEEVGEGTDVSFPLERLDEAWRQPTDDVFVEDDDVVVLKDELFAPEAAGDGALADAFGHLVDEVLSPQGAPAFEVLEDDEIPVHFVREWRWTGGGFDWDRFALGVGEVDHFRALSEIVSSLDAFSAAILTEADGQWAAQSSVGLSDAGKERLVYPVDSPFTKAFLSIRALHLLSGGEAHPVLQASFHEKDLKFLRAVACVPLLFHHGQAWLILGLKEAPEDLLAWLAPRRIG